MYPDMETAQHELEAGYKQNPGRWTDHCRYVGQACKHIAYACGMDEKKAEVLGTLHDIGRRVGVVGIRHIFEGYKYAMEKGWDEVAKISMTHSFSEDAIVINPSMMDMTSEEHDFTMKYLASIKFDDYDRLAHLCDNIALHSGYVLMEKRMIDISMRHGVHDGTVARWKRLFALKDYFEKKMNGKTIYDVLPGVVENTFKK